MEISQIKALQEQRANLWGQAKALHEAATAENREFNGEEQASWTKLNEQMDVIDKRAKELADVHQRNLDAQAAFGKLLDTPEVPGRREERSTPSFAAEFRAFARGEKGRAIEVKPDRNDPDTRTFAEVRALSKLTAAAGANTVKTSFYDRLVAHLIEVSGILKAGPTVLNTSTGETIQIPITTAHSSGALVAEAATIPTSEPTFGQRSLGAYKYGALMQVSTELVNDTSVDLEGYLAMQAGRAVGNAFGTHLITGTGSSQPSGIITTATAGVTGGTGVAGAPTADNLIDLYYSVISPYRDSPNAAWIMRDATIATLRKMKDTTGQYLWQPSLSIGSPDTFLGKPIYTDPNVAAVATSAVSIAFGDMSQYFVRMVDGVRFERSDDFAFSTDLITFRCLIRGDGILADQTGAVKKFTGAAS
jgi:HK97 family phage major capsid protein